MPRTTLLLHLFLILWFIWIFFSSIPRFSINSEILNKKRFFHLPTRSVARKILAVAIFHLPKRKSSNNYCGNYLFYDQLYCFNQLLFVWIFLFSISRFSINLQIVQKKNEKINFRADWKLDQFWQSTCRLHIRITIYLNFSLSRSTIFN